MKINKIFLLLTLTLLLLGLTYATDTTNDTSNTDPVASKIQTTSTPTHIVEDNTNNENHYNKEINKVDEKNTKTASQTVDINDFDTLHNTLTSNEYDTLTLNIKSDIQLTNNTTISESISQLTINGNGNTINGNNKYQFLKMNCGNVIITNIIIDNCFSTSGGAIYNKGNLTLKNTIFTGNTARYSDGGVIYNNNGTITITDSTLNNNNAYYGNAGAIYNKGTISITNTTLNENSASNDFNYCYGGAIYNKGTISITNTTLNENSADGAALYNNEGTITITDSIIENNCLYYDNIAIYNNGTITITNTRLNNNKIAISNSGNLTISQSTINNNTPESNGRAISNSGNLTIINSTLNQNTVIHDDEVTRGGAIYNNGNLILNKSTLYNNTAEQGGAIYNKGTLLISQSTLNNNNAPQGGAIYNQGILSINDVLFENNNNDIENNGRLFLINTTFRTIRNMNTIYISENDTFKNNINNQHKIYYFYKLKDNERNFTYLNSLIQRGETEININYDIKLDLFNNEAYTFLNGININSDNIIINGNNHTIDAQNLIRIFNNQKNVTLKNITLINGNNTLGGAIYNNGNLILNKSTLYNNTAEQGGAIYNQGNLTITQSTLNQNRAEDGGAIKNHYGNLTLTNTTLNKNQAYKKGIWYDYSPGGTINNIGGVLIIIHCTLNNNGAAFGGAINNEGTLIITDSVLNKNIASTNMDTYGGAIYNKCNLTINNSILNNNFAYYGGAIHNCGNLTINYSTINNNNETYDGAICNYGNLTLTQSTLNNNSDAIVNYGNLTITKSTLNNNTLAIANLGNLTITNSTLNNNLRRAVYNNMIASIDKCIFENNLANLGSAIYSTSQIIVNNNTFIKNMAMNLIPPAINDNGTDTIIKDNINNDNSEYYSTIYIEGVNNIITYNRFYDEKNTLKIIIDPIKTVTYGDNVSIIGTFTDIYENPRANSTLKVYINGKSISTRTDINGKFSVTSKVGIIGTNNVTVNYSGDNYYHPTNTSTTFIVQKQDTNITINKIPDTTYNQNITINGTLNDKNNNILINMPIKLTLNNDTITLTTDNEGIFTYANKTLVTGENNITVKYEGNIYYNPSETITTFIVNKQDLKITINPIKDVIYGHNVTITGKFTDGLGNPRQNSALKVYINGKSVSTRTDSNGKFSVESKVGVIGTNNVTASHQGGANYNPTSTSTTFKMKKQDLKITVNKISTIVYGNKVNITGTLKDSDNNIRANTGVKILINGKSATAKTDKNGNYVFTTKIGKLGVNNVTVSHAGGANYNPASASTTYTVVKQDLKITLDNINSATLGNVTITGRFTDSQDNPRSNTGLKISINGKTATAKTDANGYFTLTSKVGKIGVNNVTAYHNGGTNYNPVSVTTTFTMKKQDLKVTIDPIKTVTYGNSVIITGTFADANGKVRANSSLKISINDKTLTTRTDSNGQFKVTSKVGNVGVNNVTISHGGGTGFNPTSTKTTFTMVKQDLKITINPISNVKKGSTVTVTGTFTDANGKVRANTNLKVNLNGKEYTTKTDTKGIFTYKTTANTLGTNTITLSHNGGANYNPTSSKATFSVIN